MKEYTKPEIVVELKLETRAGSPLGGPLGIDPTDPLNLYLTKE